MTLDKPPNAHASLEQLIKDVHAFHGQDIYISIESGIARKKWTFRIVFTLIDALARSRLANATMLVMVLLGYRAFRTAEKDRPVFQYGLSQNNIVSFERLNNCLPEALRCEISLNGQPVSLWARLSVALSLKSLWGAACVLAQQRHPRALPHLQGVIASATYLLYSQRPIINGVKLLCVSSDHSPISQGLLFSARQVGVKTCYIQHAPVTEYFPPLSFDLSILYDRASTQAYSLAAQREGRAGKTDIILLPPFNQEFKRPHLEKPPYTVGICLSFLPDIKQLTELIEALHKHNSVKGVLLRRHPRCTLDLSRLTHNPATSIEAIGEVSHAFFNKVDLVLIPNSGVAVESLHRGCPSFYTPNMDDLPLDYHKFVVRGILPEFRADLLDDPKALLSFFDEDWEARFGEHDETVQKPIAAAQAAVSEAFERLIYA